MLVSRRLRVVAATVAATLLLCGTAAAAEDLTVYATDAAGQATGFVFGAQTTLGIRGSINDDNPSDAHGALQVKLRAFDAASTTACPTYVSSGLVPPAQAQGDVDVTVSPSFQVDGVFSGVWTLAHSVRFCAYLVHHDGSLTPVSQLASFPDAPAATPTPEPSPTPTPTPTPVAIAKPTLALSADAATLRVASNAFKAGHIVCAAACTVTAKAVRHGSWTTVATATLSRSAASPMTVKIALTPAGRKILKAKGRLKIDLKLKITSAGRTTTVSRGYHLR